MLLILTASIKNYTSARFDRLSRSQLSFGIYFTAPWCTQCVQAEAELEAAAVSFYKVFEVLRVNCAEAEQKEVCIQFKAKKLPELHLLNFIPDKKHVKFDLDFTSKNIERFVREHMNTPLHVS